MNMLTSLKALLFSSAAMKLPVPGDGTGAASPGGEVDFAALLNGSMKGDAVAVSDAPPHLGEAGMEEGSADFVPPMTIVPGNPGERFFPTAPATPLPPVEATDVPVEPEDIGKAPAVAVQADPKPMAVPPSEERPEAASDALDMEAGDAKPVEDEKPADKAQAKTTDETATAIASPALPAPPVIVAPAVPAVPAPPHGSAAKDGEVVLSAPSAAKPGGMVERAEKIDASAPPVPVPQGSARAAGKPENPVRTQAGPVVTDEAPKSHGNAPPVLEKEGKGTAFVEAKPSVAPADKPPVAPMDKAAASTSDDDAVAAAMTEKAPPSAAAAPKLPRSEALSLLQMVREQFARPSPETARAPEAIATAHAGGRDAKRVIVEMAPLAAPIGQTDSAGNGTAPLPQVAPAGAPAAPAAVMPAADIGASLGAQVVDMGVSGQWIDGLARDIAGLAQHGAQGRFQINASRLGPVQVDIRHGADGAAISLTVANEAAELALKQDSDRLRLDAGLAAVRISDVKIERAPPMTEAARPDGAGQSGGQQSGQQQPGQQSSSQGAASAWQGGGQGGQGMGQSERQGHWQSRENFASGLKASSDRAVINQKDAGDGAGDARRARYA